MSFYKVLLKNPLVSTISNHIDGYPTPVNLTYLWGLGSLAGLALVIQIVTGVLLAMHYAAEIHLAFASVEHIMRDVKGGVALRYIHANGASMFFIIVYLHMFRGLYYGSYFQPRANLWYSGVLIFFLMMATGFLGYVLPWGQMSFWGATVITNLFSAIPGIGNQIVQLLWGGFSVDNPTLNRFFSLHYFLPFALAGIALLHLIFLHQPGSNNPLGIPSVFDRIPFYPYFYVKDLFGFFIFVLIFSLFVVYAPNYMGHPDNYIEANPLVTPAHIVPEWYFLPFYAILRTVPDKLGGVALMGLAIVILVLLPVVDTSSFRSNFFKPLNIWFFWYFFADSVSLGWIGQEIVESPFIEMGVFVTVSYFLYFITFLPLTGFLENTVIQNQLRHASLLPFVFNISARFGGNSEDITTTFKYNSINTQSIFFDFFNNLELIQIAFVGGFLLFLGMFFPKSGTFTRFLNRLGAFYLIYLLCNLSFNVVLRPMLQMTTATELSNAINLLQSDSIFNHLFFCYILVMVIIFLYGISDRYFISNSYEIEFPVLVFFLHVASLFLFSVHSLLEFVLAIEIITLGSYGLVAFERKNRFSTYAGVQYFILGSVPSGLLILSIALLYKAWGSFAIDDLDLLMGSFAHEASILNFWEFSNFFVTENQNATNIDTDTNTTLYAVINDDYITKTFNHYAVFEWNDVMNEASKYSTITLLALLLLLTNLLFKLTAAPFHFWAPSVYGKAPIATVTFLSIFSKAMILFALFKLLFTVFYTFKNIIMPFLIFVSVLSVLLGMIGAFSEKVIKRFFVYSSMGHVGFMLISLSLSSYEGIAATFHYLPVYIITSFLMWFILLHIGSEKNHLTHFAMLRISDPLLALIFALLIFSMSGIPPLGGFFVKLDVLIALLENSRLYTNAILLFFTVASFFYYLRVVKIIFFDNTKVAISSSNISDERLWMIGLLFIVLFFYLFLIQKPLLIIQNEALAALF
jgi:ubiquinol-cytochrome c reductase cytochrome b subunit